MIIISGKVFNLDGKNVTVGGEKRFVLNFNLSEYLGKKDGEPQYRSAAVSVWDRRAEGLAEFLTEKSIVTVKSNHYAAEGYISGNNDEDKPIVKAKIKIEIGYGDLLDVLHMPSDSDTAVNVKSDFSDDERDPFAEEEEEKSAAAGIGAAQTSNAAGATEEAEDDIRFKIPPK